MFYYYGRRKQIAHLYPKPKYTHIIEPFAGSAAYALYHSMEYEYQVTLIDKNKDVAEVWQFLLNASKKDILSLPDVQIGEDIRKLSLSSAERKLIGFHINPGSTGPRNIVMKASRWGAGKKYIANNIHRVKNWNFLCDDFTIALNIEATWFIDPPFAIGGRHYTFGEIDYNFLADWCKNRSGQVIVCEAEPANWLPFKYLVGDVGVNNGGLNGSKKRLNLIYEIDNLYH
jgi:16S rRNA G966 N2-methylase RsmD